MATATDKADNEAPKAQVKTSKVPEDRFCDLVMKGGITSGLVYPKAIGHLSRHYRFKSIGGTSAGAIAAAITAAAEFQRRQHDSTAGFDLLEGLPEELQEEVPGTRIRKLLSLFQPQRGAHRLFSVLVGTLNRGGGWQRLAMGVLGLYRSYWVAPLTSLAAALVIGYLGWGWFAAGLFFLVASIGSIGFWVYWDITRVVVKNGFGLCTGMSENGKPDALTPWLHRQIQTAARLGPNCPPLTFGQLWEANGFPNWLTLPAGADRRSIDLQIVCTNLSHGRPYIFPLPTVDRALAQMDTGESLYFKEAELKQYLPTDVLASLVKFSKPYAETRREGLDPPPGEETKDLRQIPPAKNFPVLLAARMSMSFPLLFSAVPLWAIDHEARPGESMVACCWFSDGGLSSNFPIHLFDGLVPLWPTFGIDLLKERKTKVLPQKYEEGCEERWNHFAREDVPVKRLGGYLTALVHTMQSWNDNALARMPGVRDRVARVSLDSGEGGLNVNMTKPQIEAIARHGLCAAQALVQQFAAPTVDGAQTPGWNEHRWIRFNVLLKMIRARAFGLANALSLKGPHVTGLGEVLDDLARARDAAGHPAPAPGYERPFSSEDVRALNTLLDRLESGARSLSSQSANEFHAIPIPELRVRPPL